MKKNEIFERLREIITGNTGVSKERITKDVNLQSDLGLTSLQIIVLLASIEDDFEIIIDTNDLTSVVDMGSFVDLIALYLEKPNRS